MSRSLRSPAVLMTAYIALFIWNRPWHGSERPASRNGMQIVVAILLAIFAARGSRSARVVMITYSIIGCSPCSSAARIRAIEAARRHIASSDVLPGADRPACQYAHV